MTRENALLMLADLIQRYEEMSPEMLSLPITGYDVKALLWVIKSLLQ